MSARPRRLEIADIIRRHGDAYRQRHPLSPQQSQVLTNLAQCRTAALGGHVDVCRGCGFVRVSYNSCRDRHCPKCQSAQRAAWLQTRLERLLPVEYFHVVFTLPEQLKPLALKNQRVIYGLLFRAAAQTLQQLAADPKRLGAQIGFTAVLHTWGQNLLFHPHLHCVVTGGGLSPDGKRWIGCRPGYFLPVKVLASLFRGKFLAGLKRAWARGELRFSGSIASLTQPAAFQHLLNRLYRQTWVVYAKPPFGGAEQVFAYLGRYTHRVAISNSRLVSMRQGAVRFQYKDYADDGKTKLMTLSAEEFLRRFLLHVLPKGFVRIRHYGLLASPHAQTKLKHCQWLLGPAANGTPTQSMPTWIDRFRTWLAETERCPRCGGTLEQIPFLAGTHPESVNRLIVLLRQYPTVHDSS